MTHVAGTNMPIPPVVVLVSPQLGENIGMAARAMHNCGLDALRLVNPRDGWPNEAARDAAVGAVHLVDQAGLFSSVRDAVADLEHVYATTSRPRSVVRRIYTPRADAEEIRDAAGSGIRSGVLFGAERAGLETDDLAACHGVIEAPLNPEYPSLNLAGAVLMMAYEWRVSSLEPAAPRLETQGFRPATQSEFDGFLDQLVDRLEAGGFFRTPELKPPTVNNLRALFRRTDPTEQEIRTLRGVVRALELAGRSEAGRQ